VFFLSETEENGFWQCRAITEDLLHCHKVQPGPKYVSTFVMCGFELNTASVLHLKRSWSLSY
jgi:hypothetical protein